MKMNLKKKELYLEEFKEMAPYGSYQYLSFYEDLSAKEELNLLFNVLLKKYGHQHLGIYRICDAEYIYCVGRYLPYLISFFGAIRFTTKTILIMCGLIKQKTGHENKVNGEFWFGEYYSIAEKRRNKEKFLNDMRIISKQGFLAPHFVYSKGRFSEEYVQPMLKYFSKHHIALRQDSYFPFYFVYAILSTDRYKSKLYQNRNVLIVTAFNERNVKENFTENLLKEGVKNIYFYPISHDKAMVEVIDQSKLPKEVDLVLIGAGIGSANIINQLSHLNALCIDAGHALDCLSRPQLRKERIFLLPDFPNK